MPRIEVPQPSPERVVEARRRLAAIWTGTDYSQPAIVAAYPASKGEASYTQTDCISDPESDLQNGLQAYSREVAALEDGFDNAPGCWTIMGSVAILPSAFGCPVNLDNPSSSWARPIVDRPEQIWDIEPADVRGKGLCRVALEHIEHVLEATGGQLVRRYRVTQSPMGIAMQVYHYQDFLLATQTHPEAAHRLLGLATRALIEFQEAQDELLYPQPWDEHWRPTGIHLADDVVAAVSPRTYREFFRPYNEQVSRRFGGFRFHCCLGYAHNLESVADTWGFLAFDPDPKYNGVRLIFDAVARARGGVWYVSAGRDADLATWTMRAARRRAGLILTLSGKTREETRELGRLVRRLAEDEAHLPALDVEEIERSRPEALQLAAR